MAIRLSEMSLYEDSPHAPSRGVVDGGGDNRNLGGKRRKSDTTPFDSAMFRQLCLERLDNHKRIEQHRRQRNWENSRLQRRSFLASSESIEIDTAENISARQELLLLGQHYASFSPSIEQMSLTALPEQISGGNVTEHVDSQNVLLQCPANGSTASNVSETEVNSPTPEEAAIRPLTHLFDINSRSSPVPEEALLHHGNETPVMTPVDEIGSTEDIGAYGSHYLLLARANYSPIPTTEADHDGGAANVIGADDGSLSASCNTPTPHLQAVSACDSNGGNEDGCELKDDTEAETDHFSSFCNAQVLISEIEDERLDGKSLCQSVANGRKHNLTKSRIENVQRVLYHAAGVAIVAFASFFSCQKIVIVRWYKLVYTRITGDLNSWQHLTPEKMKNSFGSKMIYARKQSFGGHSIIRLILCAKVAWQNTVSIYRDWAKDVDMLSWLFQNIYRLEKLYYDALQLFNATRCRFLKVQDSSFLVFNVTFVAAISFWQQLEGAPLSHFSYKSTEHIVIRSATLTTPIIFCSNNGCTSKAPENETLSLGNDADHDISMSPQFWRKCAKGTPFVRRQLPSGRSGLHRCIHGNHAEGRDSLASQWHISSPAFNQHRHDKKWTKILFPAVRLNRSRLLFNSHRLESLSFCPGVRRIIEHAKKHRMPPQTVTTKRNYYAPSYVLQPREKHNEKDIFDDVDMMGMVWDFVAQYYHFMRRRFSNKRQSTKGQ